MCVYGVCQYMSVWYVFHKFACYADSTDDIAIYHAYKYKSSWVGCLPILNGILRCMFICNQDFSALYMCLCVLMAVEGLVFL